MKAAHSIGHSNVRAWAIALSIALAGCASREVAEPESSALPPSEVQPRGEEQPPMSELPPPEHAEALPPGPSESPAVPESPEASTSTVSAEAPSPPPPPTPEELADVTLHAEYLADLPDERIKSPCYQEVSPDEPMLDETRRMLVETLCATALWADSLFGEPGDVQAARNVHGHVELSGGYSQFEGTKIRVRLDVRADLPTLKHRLKVFIGRDNENDFLRDRSEGFALRSQFPRVDDKEGWLGGLGYSLPETDRLRSEFRVGVHGLNPPQVFMQWRTRFNIYSSPTNVFYIRATPFWNSDDGVGLTMNFDISQLLSSSRLLRLSTAATRSQHTEGIDWRTAVILYQNLREGRAIAAESFVRGATQAAEPLGEYGERFIYRQPIVQQKLFLEAVIGYSWPRNDPSLPRDGSVGAGLSIDMPFGKS